MKMTHKGSARVELEYSSEVLCYHRARGPCDLCAARPLRALEPCFDFGGDPCPCDDIQQRAGAHPTRKQP